MNGGSVLDRVVYAWGTGETSLLRTTEGKLYEADIAVQQLELEKPEGTDPLFPFAIEVTLPARPGLVVSSSSAAARLGGILDCEVWPADRFLAEQRDEGSVLWLSDCPDAEVGVLVEERAREQGMGFAAIELRFPNLYVVPSNGWTYRDLTLRRRAVAAKPEVADTVAAHPDLDNAAPVLEALLGRARFAFGPIRPCEIVSYAADGEGPKRSIVVPWADNPVLSEQRAIGDLDELVDEDHGVISRLRVIRHTPTVPASLKTIQSDVGNTRRICRWTNNTVCQGSTFDDVEVSRYAAIGESVERYCINLLDTLPIQNASARELQSQGWQVIDFRRLVLFSPEQYTRAGFPFVPFDEGLKLPWVPGTNLVTGQESWVPMSMVYVNYRRMEELEFPPIESIPYTGVAAGGTHNYAVMSSLEEIVERDATMVWWHSQPAIPTIAIQDPKVSEIVAFAAQHGTVISFLSLPNEFRLPVVAAVLRSDEEQIVNVGFACRPTIVEAALKALTEAYTLQDGSRDLLCPHGQLRQAIERREFLATAIRPYRGDRHYLDDVAADFSDVDDLMMQQQVNLDPRAEPYRAPWLTPPLGAEPLQAQPLERRTLDAYLGRITDAGYEPVVVDVTSPDMRAMGAWVVKTIVPGLVPNFPAGHPHLGQGRIQNEYARLGILTTSQTPEQLHYFPLPHA